MAVTLLLACGGQLWSIARTGKPLEASQAYWNQMSTLDVNKWRTDYCGYTDVYWLRSEVHFCACFHRWENWLLIWVRVRVRVRLCGATYIYIDITLHNK
jgi:hypothetical protein